ncbi:MAG: hypothetical protein DRJ41_01475 [Thermoprotei archaeon]|nr:MAG: hypothetical protein DRJ41_01475 [Thermoprotei archaeon]
MVLSVEITIREVQGEEDYPGIVEVHCSDVERWYKYVDGRKIEARYKELTPFERWLNGGPWMDLETIHLHFDILKSSKGKAFIAIANNEKVVGEAEIVFSEEPEPYGRYCFLEVLVVHRDYRRRGIGTKLVKHCLEYARSHGYKLFDTIPEDERSKNLYIKLGFKRMFYLYKMRKTCEKGVASLYFKRIPAGEHPKDKLLISGHWYSSVYIWQNILRAQDYNKFKGFNFKEPLFFEIIRNEEVMGLLSFQAHFLNPKLSISYIWVKPRYLVRKLLTEIARCIAYKALELGFNEVFVEVDEVNAPAFLSAKYKRIGKVEYLRKFYEC